MYFEGEDQEVSRSTADLNRTTTHPLVNGKRVEELATSIEPSNSSHFFPLVQRTRNSAAYLKAALGNYLMENNPKIKKMLVSHSHLFL